MRTVQILFAGAVATLAMAGTAQAASFNGSCEFSGVVKFNPPMTTTPQPIAQYADAPGTCTGTFVDRRGRSYSLDGTPATDRAWSSGDLVSCEFGLASGTGFLSFPRGRIHFTMQEYRPGATPMIQFTGRRSGGAWMAVTPSQSSDPVAALQACSGAGLSEFDLDGQFQTNGAISG
jgi:hypothetical protein